MKKILGFLIIYFFSAMYVLSADLRFVQVDGVLLNKDNATSLSALENVVSDINKQKNVEFVVFSGNNISKPSKENLECFVKIAKNLNCPYYFILGNKDVNKQKNLGKKEYFEFLKKRVKAHKKIDHPNYVFIKKDIAFIVVDGSKEVIPTSQGYFREETLDWLEARLNEYSDKKVIILQHFPIVPPSKREAYYTFKAEEYLELVESHKNIKAVISGHFNANNEQDLNNILHISTANAPQYRIIDILDYEKENPIIWCTIKR